MNITLIYPLLSKDRSKVDENKQYWPPLGLAYIAAVLRENGHSVQILDRDLILRKNRLNFDETDEITLSHIRDFKTQVVGFSTTTPNVSDVNTFSRKVKKINPEIVTVIGGPHCAGEPVATLEMCNGIDMLVRGEGEMVMLDIANGISKDSMGSLTYRKSDGSIVSNPDRPLIESLDSLPSPARDMLDMNYYTRPSRFISRNLSLRTTHIFTARGCPYNCHYCAGPLIGQRMVRYHSSQRVVSEIEELIDKYSVEAVYFAEDMFLSSKKRVREMTTLFMEHGIHKKIVWMAQVSPKVADTELLSMMKDAGCVHVEYGFESGSQRILDLMNKRANVERNKEVAILTRKSGLRFQGNFIVGYPGETEEDFNKTISFIKETHPNNVSLNLFMPLPGTEIYKKLKNEGKLLPNWDDIGNPETPYINYADMPSSYFERLYFNAKLRVILPSNLRHFIKDNIRHPLRLSYVAITQFKSVVTRAIKAVTKLRHLSGKNNKGLNVLFIAYHAASNSLMESQGIAYMRGLSKKGIGYSLFTFEPRETLINSIKFISELDIPLKWKYQIYHQKPRFLATFYDIIFGILTVAFIIKRNKIKFVHARGFIAALIGFLPAKILGVKIFFDTRGLLADKYVCGGLLNKDSFTYKLMRLGENFLIRKSDYFTVETQRHAEVIRNSQNGISAKMDVIPCCVDINKFNYQLYPHNMDNRFNLIFLGKIGTWYLLEDMLKFFMLTSKEFTSTHFTFITESNAGYIYSTAKEKGIDVSNVTVRKVGIKDVPSLLSGASVSISFMNPYKHYSFSPIKFAESLACGLPVIINRGIGDCDEIVVKEKVGVVINEFSVKEYERAIRELNRLLSEGEGLRERCRATAEKYFSLEMGVERYWDIYKRTMGRV
jgi:radical SAM superfamily enzyme YgiQ (UPF0313 family)/glycosyltransferase involved in cell wall biosynthesis